MNSYLRFECGARLPQTGYLTDVKTWTENAKDAHENHGSYKPRKDGRYRCVVFDTNGGITHPKFEDGRNATCLGCPCPKRAGRRDHLAMPEDVRHGRRIFVTCYPEEVYEDATSKVASATSDIASVQPASSEDTASVQPASVPHTEASSERPASEKC